MGVFSLWKGMERCTHNVSILCIQRLLLKILFKKKGKKKKKERKFWAPKVKERPPITHLKFKFK